MNFTLDPSSVIAENSARQCFEWCEQQHFAVNYENVELIGWATLGLGIYFGAKLVSDNIEDERIKKLAYSIYSAAPYFSFFMLLGWIVMFIWGVK
jgi:hypothetical protein